jgi:L-fuconolactonase
MSRKPSEELPVIPHREPDPQWLRASDEEPLLPWLPIIDSHHHFSEHWGGCQPSDLLTDGDGHHVQATVYIQSGWHQRATGPDHRWVAPSSFLCRTMAELWLFDPHLR